MGFLDVLGQLITKVITSMGHIEQTDSRNEVSTVLGPRPLRAKDFSLLNDEDLSCSGCSGLCIRPVWADLLEAGTISSGILARQIASMREALGRSVNQQNSISPTSKNDPWGSTDPWSKTGEMAALPVTGSVV